MKYVVPKMNEARKMSEDPRFVDLKQSGGCLVR